MATLGRSIGGPLGGWLVDMIGWRWSFYIQVPPILSAIFLIIWYLPETKSQSLDYDSDGEAAARRFKSKLSRVDFKGSILFALVVLTFLLPVELGGVELPWTSGPIMGLFTLSTVLLYVFVVVERGQEEPILPLEIFERRDAVISYLILGLQTAAQVGVSYLRTREIALRRGSEANRLTTTAYVFCAAVLPDRRACIQHRCWCAPRPGCGGQRYWRCYLRADHQEVSPVFSLPLQIFITNTPLR